MERKKKRRKPSKDGLFLRGNIFWANIHGERVSTGCKDREAARIVRARLEREAADPAHDASRRTTVADMIEAVLADRAHAKGKHGALVTNETIDIYRTKLGHVARILGEDTPLYEVNYESVGRYITQRFREQGLREKSKVSQHTVHKELAALRFGLRLMQEQGKYPHRIDHVTRVRRFAVGYKPRKRHLTWEEIPKLISALLVEQRHRVRPATLRVAKDLRADGNSFEIIAVALGVSLSTAKRYVDMEPEPSEGAKVRAQHAAWYIATGGRDEESNKAELDDYDLTKWTAHLRGTKTGQAERTIPIAPGFRPLLVFALEGRPKRGRIFPPWTNVNRSLRLACERAGIERVSPNDLRRTHSSLLRQAGVALEDIAPILGHTTTRMLEVVYGRTNLNAIQRAVSIAVAPIDLLPKKGGEDA